MRCYISQGFTGSKDEAYFLHSQRDRSWGKNTEACFGQVVFFFLHGLLGLKLVDLASWHESRYVLPFYIIIHV